MGEIKTVGLCLLRRPFSRVELISAEGDVVLQLIQALALRLDCNQCFLRLCCFGLEGSDLVLCIGDLLFQMLSHFVGCIGQLLANRRDTRLFCHHLRIVSPDAALGGFNRTPGRQAASLSGPKQAEDQGPTDRLTGR